VRAARAERDEDAKQHAEPSYQGHTRCGEEVFHFPFRSKELDQEQYAHGRIEPPSAW